MTHELVTERLVLRPWTEDDADDALGIYHAPELIIHHSTCGTGFPATKDKETPFSVTFA